MTDLQAIPILLTPSIPETRAFAETLGFDVESFGDGYAVLRGHGIELHYSFTTRPEVCSETSCYVRGGGILALHAALRARNPAQLSDIVSRPWGMTEFYLHDPHGNLLKFGMSTDELPSDFQPNTE
ncbi:VOC family protein [Falsiphaeobacter marinintestinus]|uniref:VOC family protein n=1 Tax=Falsiphaeobacter marinintestinus TaxID=1492905 RepID=UPI0011B3F3AC|nr:VOC family protein [Phaeobacter marinintestinus]